MNTAGSEAKVAQIMPDNVRGRDFVAGDLHGCCEALYEMLDEAYFNEDTDRLFLVGDLINRGPDSFGTLSLLMQPWVHVVRGNHEDMLLSKFGVFDSDYHLPSSMDFNGGAWLESLTVKQECMLIEQIIPKIMAAPYIRTVIDGQGEPIFHVTHAELMAPSGLGDDVATGEESGFYTDKQILSLANVSIAATERDVDIEGVSLKRLEATCTWGRRTVRQLLQHRSKGSTRLVGYDLPGGLLATPTPYARGLAPTFVGHTILPTLAMHASHIFIDRGLYISVTENDPDVQLALLNVKDTLAIIARDLPRDQGNEINHFVVDERKKLPLPAPTFKNGQIW